MISDSRLSRRLGAVLIPLAVLALAPALPAQRPAQDTVLSHPLSLGDAARLAGRLSASAQAARYRTAQAEARVTQTRAQLLPDISAGALGNGRSFNTATFGIPLPGFDPNGSVISGVNTVDFRGRASMNLLDFSAFGRIRGAKTAAEASSFSAESVAEEAATTAALAYLNAQRADAQLAARQADSVLADSLVSIAEAQLAAGVGVALDVTRARAQMASVHAQLIAARNARDRTRLALVRALGLPLGSPVNLADSLASLPVIDTLPNENGAIERAIANRPDVRAADAQLAAARQGVSAIKAERLPSLSAFGDEGWIGINTNHLLNTYDWGVQISVPIFDGFHREGRIEEQTAAVREIDVQRRDLRQQVATEVRTALLDLASARQEMDAARERLQLAEQELAQATDRFRTGVAGNADVITATLALNASRNLMIDALTNYQTARVALAHAEGSVTKMP
ncbi:MAG TPA: TolC family protein [Gemmatimonadaceae bacterium]|nr:TolC family protein [Gemmatimonadaceae bacterium]